MAMCSSCGSPIPDGQGSSCSMCYGDIAHGSDGYYQAWAEEQMRLEQEQQESFDDFAQQRLSDYEPVGSPSKDNELPF